MIGNGSNFSQKVAKKFHCQFCDYSTSKSNDFKKHLSTDKHKKTENYSKMVVNGSDLSQKVAGMFQCECGKVYKYDSGYYRHKKTCIGEETQYIDGINIKDKDALVLHLLKQNGELQNKLIELSTEKSITNNTNTNSFNTTNNAFNLNFFLNETCKDAMNITDFVSSIKLSLEDLENTGRRGYIEGVSNIIVKNLSNLEQHMRPLHCSDFKREVIYIKDNDKWTQETSHKPILTKAVKTIANENIKQIKTWREKNPDCTDADSKKNNLYLKIVSNSMNGLTKEEGDRNINKIISNVAKETVIKRVKCKTNI
jgi:hypothetical protein